jgi:hypothetical protein
MEVAREGVIWLHIGNNGGDVDHVILEKLDYDRYNREERYVCAHLFRLLHEPAGDYMALRQFLGGHSDVAGFRIFAEVALIRDAYHERRGDPRPLMDALVAIVARQEQVCDYRSYSQLEPVELRTPHLTHPRQIRYKAAGSFSEGENIVYGAVQGMFNAKPDLVICVGSQLIVYEAKLTLGFDEEQLKRTRNIAEVWAHLLYRDLGYQNPPDVIVRKLGLEKYKPDVSWKSVTRIAESVYPEGDRSRRALSQAAALG